MLARRCLLALAALVLAIAGSPAQAQTAVHIEGDPADIAQFAGEWVGGYTCEDTGRHGTIVFRLVAGDDSVRAVVLMIPRATDDEFVPDAIPLAIHRIEIEGGSLSGVLVRYNDPEWHLPLDTSFGGTLERPDHIEGFFRAVGSQIDTIPQLGRWWATRASDRPVALR